MYLDLAFAARSDVGLLRSSNQDSAYAGPHLLVVADGMGGAAGGDIASSIAVATLAGLDAEVVGADEAIEALKDALASAHADIVARAQNDPELSGLGTTVTAILRAGNAVAMAHVGDSRAYLLRDGTLDQLTTDHSFVQHLVDTGRISAAEAENHPKRSMLLRVLGDIDADIPIDISAREAHAGDRFLLCTDGLSSVVSRSTLAKVMAAVPDPGGCADELVALALAAGAPDNVTCIIADVIDTDGGKKRRAVATPQIVGSAATAQSEQPSSALTPARERVAEKPAAKAAALKEPVAEGERLARPREGRWERIRPWALPASIFLIVFGGSFSAWVWTQRQYYVADHDGMVAIFRGIPQSIGPIHLSSLVTDDTGVAVADLESFELDRLESDIRAGSLEEAWDIVDALGGAD
jgi:protein phosphatase